MSISTRLKHYQRRVSELLWQTGRTVRGGKANVLLITYQNRISDSQIFPFYFFRTSLRDELGLDFTEVSLTAYLESPARWRGAADLVFLQPWWDTPQQQLHQLLDEIRGGNPGAKIVFLDSFAPLDLRLAQFVGSGVDVYVKKQLFRDRCLYGKPTRGDTNLVDYYGKLYQLDYPETTFPIPAGFIDKLIVGPSFSTSDFLLPRFMRADFPEHSERSVDLHARLGGSEDSWYGRMRDHARSVVKAMGGIRAATEGAIGHRQYMQELGASKICFSPFGYGEVCWRDYEAVMCGALLLKPDMSHVETDPDIFRAGETYVPVRWDFSDLEEKVRHYLAHDDERVAIARNAYEVLSQYFRNNGFQDHVRRVIRVAGGAC